MATRDGNVERLVNLTFAFLEASRSGRPYLTSQWLREHVAGYGGVSEDTARKRLQRDLRTLAQAGVPLEVRKNGSLPAYRLREEDYELEPVEFSAEEAAVLGVAGQMGRGGQLGAFARSGWTKIAAGGAQRDLGITPPELTGGGDWDKLSARALTTIVAAITRGRRLEFRYRGEATRVMDPWGIVNHRDRLYLVGFDIERAQPRSFRLLRTADFREVGSREHEAGDRDLQAIVVSALERHGQRVDARVRLRPGRALELREAGEMVGDTVTLRGVDRDWLVRTVAAYGPDAILLDNTPLRAEVLALLREAA
ncbi:MULTISPECIES: helix-turn-helix transcriptional regulator [unclassified Corynebacterium]|uniref:helix-turn-helix transcriptional regulator n=1 Tax=unclassified Corynebacterium TaxID=2624378 RepID=UPI0029CA69A0|nr:MULTISPECIES: WYL domain-containing protein [unclassified Corynebacterium]WPF67187.1 WYL domain-containing protein [Corynebacterium sp. 22KM0430]WPF69676.1 WYL domain-containing protein [Corynebacterium sp. 21KM1197]